MAIHAAAATDMSQQSAPVIEGAVRFARTVGSGSLSILHVVTEERLRALEEERPEEFRFADVVIDQLRADLRQQVRVAGGGDLPVHPHVLRGEAGHVILDWAAQHEPDYLAIGVRNRSRVGKLVFGSTSQIILLGASIPVIAIPTT